MASNLAFEPQISLGKAFILEGLQSADYSISSTFSGRTNESPPVFYRTSSPLEPLPCFLLLQFKIMQSRATGIADHILPLSDLFSLTPQSPHVNHFIVVFDAGDILSILHSSHGRGCSQTVGERRQRSDSRRLQNGRNVPLGAI